MSDDNAPPGGGVTFYDLLATPPRQPRDWRRFPRLVRRSVLLTWNAGRPQFLVIAAVNVIMGFTALAQVVVTRELLVAVSAPKAGHVGDVVTALGLFVVLFTFTRIAGAAQAGQSEILQELVVNETHREVMAIAGRVDLAAFDDPSFYDRLQRAAHSSGIRSIDMVQGLFTLSASATRMLGLFIAIALLKPILLVPVVFAYIPLWYATRRNSRDAYQYAYGMTPLERQRDYLHMLLTDQTPAKEVRAFGLVDFACGRFDQLAARHLAEHRAVVRRRFRREALAGLQAMLLMGCTTALLAWFYASGQIGLSAAGAVMAALLQMSGALGGVAAGGDNLHQASLFLDDYTSFTAQEAARKKALPEPRQIAPFQSLVVDRVSFSYPASSKPVLEDVSLHVNSGEVVALVGENGSGKTTLAKLMAALYRPASGRILWDGTDAAECDPEELRRHVTVVFQDFTRFRLTARENIGLGRPARLDDTAGIEAAAQLAGVYELLADLPDGFETMLSQQFFGGRDLSLGQWQRMALARAFFRDAPFIVLDEPTASLDARAEQQLFERVRELFRGRAVLLISHRFSTVRTADRIYVLNAGRIIEHGDHKSLIEDGGLYSELYNMQASAYAEGA